VSVFPSLYADALYALDSELDRIFDTEDAVADDAGGELAAEPTSYRVLGIGQSVIFEGYDVKVRIDDFFGGHSAVLGNT
jgi:hypothetical protein